MNEASWVFTVDEDESLYRRSLHNHCGGKPGKGAGSIVGAYKICFLGLYDGGGMMGTGSMTHGYY